MSKGQYLLVAMRDGAQAQQAEYADFRRATGLDDSQLVHLPIESLATQLSDLSQFDGVFVGGSPFNITDWQHSDLQKYSHDILFEVLRSPTPALLVCYGTSYTAFTLGGEVSTTFSEGAGTSEVHLTAAAASDPIASQLPESFLAVTGHKECVVTLPSDAVLLATGPTCPYQMYRVPNRNWVTQFHPEMDADGLLRRMLFYVDEGYFDPAELATIEREVRAADLNAAGHTIAAFMHYCSYVKDHSG